jgi:uncharacterized protein YndB with AHSA1/START domain
MSDDDPIVITRDLDLPVPAHELWAWMVDGDRWAEWLTERADVVVEPDQVGTVVDDDGVERRVVVRSVDPGERVTFHWWPTDRPDDGSFVELVVVPLPGDGDGDRSRLSIIETYATMSMSRRPQARSAGLSWELRMTLLAFCVQAVALVRT